MAFGEMPDSNACARNSWRFKTLDATAVRRARRVPSESQENSHQQTHQQNTSSRPALRSPISVRTYLIRTVQVRIPQPAVPKKEPPALRARKPLPMRQTLPPFNRPEVSFSALCAIATRELRADLMLLDDQVEWKERIKDRASRDGFRTPSSDQVHRAMSAVEHTWRGSTVRTNRGAPASRRVANSPSNARTGESLCPHQPPCATFHVCRDQLTPPPATEPRARRAAIIESAQTDLDGHPLPPWRDRW